MSEAPQARSADDAPLTLGPLGKADVNKAARFAAALFAHLAPEDRLRRVLRDGADPEASLALRRGEEIVGVYLVRKPNIHFPFLDVVAPSYPDLKGRRLDLLALSPDLRGQGYGRLLREAVRTDAREAGFDYVWGAAGDKLANREQWLDVRALDRDFDGGFVSLDPLTPAARSAFSDKASETARSRWRRDGSAPPELVSSRQVLQRTPDGGSRIWSVSPEGAHAGPSIPGIAPPAKAGRRRAPPRDAVALRSALAGPGGDRGTSRALPYASEEDIERLSAAGFVMCNVDSRLGWARQNGDGDWVQVLARPMPKDREDIPSEFALMIKEPNKRARYRWIGIDEVLAEAGLSAAPRMAP